MTVSLAQQLLSRRWTSTSAICQRAMSLVYRRLSVQPRLLLASGKMSSSLSVISCCWHSALPMSAGTVCMASCVSVCVPVVGWRFQVPRYAALSAVEWLKSSMPALFHVSTLHLSLFNQVRTTLCKHHSTHCIDYPPGLRVPLKLHLTTSELWFGQEHEGILPELFSSSSIV